MAVSSAILHPTLQSISSVNGSLSPEKPTGSADDGGFLFVTTTSSTVPPAALPRSTAAVRLGAKRSSDQPTEMMRCKRRISFAQLGYNLPQAPPSAVSRRNERERNRVKLVNLGFATLREHVPNGSKNKKMSKVETLRSAVEYIRKLQELLEETEAAGAGSPYGTDSSATGSPVHAENFASVANGGGANHHGPLAGLTCPPSSVSPTCSVASSPTPSYTSDYSYEPLSPEEEDLLDFTSWFS